MKPVSTAENLQDSRVHLICGQIAEEIEAAQAGNRDPDISNLFEQYPELAEQIRQMIPTIQLVCSVGRTEALPPASVLPETAEVVAMNRQQLGDYQIIREIGRGGMGVVYEAQQLSLDRRVALKVLPLASFLDARQLQRFKNEARAAAALRHPNIVGIHAVGCERSVHFYAMDLIDGQDLAVVIRHLHKSDADRPPPRDSETHAIAKLLTQRSGQRVEFYRSVARIGMQAAGGLHFAHQEGVIHRDVKPANLLLDRDGDIHITDFGLARLSTEQDLTLTGDLVGTLRYMSPEQVEGRVPVNQRGDVYSLGLTLYEMLAGHAAFEEASRQRLYKAIIENDPKPLHKHDPSVPRDLRIIVEKAISKLPEDRYHDAREFAADLDRFLFNRTVVARPTTSLARVSRFCNRNPMVTSLLVTSMLLCVLIATGASAWAWQLSVHSNRRAVELRERELEVNARDIRLANAAIAEGNLVEGEQILLRSVTEGRKAARGIEWYYLWSLCHPSDVVRSISHQTYVADVAFSPDGTRLADAFASRELPIWDLTKRADQPAVRVLSCDSVEKRVIETFDQPNLESSLLVAGDNNGNVYVWDWDNLDRLMPPFKVDTGTSVSQISSIDLHPNGSHLAIGAEGSGGSGHIEIYDLAERRIVFTKPHRSGASHVGFDNAGRLVVTAENDRRVEFYNVPSGDFVQSHALDGNPTIAAVSSGRDLLAVAVHRELGSYDDTWVEVRNLDDWSERFRFAIPDVQVRSMAFSNNGQRLAVGDCEGTLWVADLVEERLTKRRMHQGRINSVNFSPDDSYLATTGADRFIHMTETGEVFEKQAGHLVRCTDIESRDVLGAAFLDESTVATTRGDCFVDVWTASSGQLLESLELESGFGTMVRFDAHAEKRLMAAGQMQWPFNSTNVVPGRVTVWVWDRTEPGAFAIEQIGQYHIPNGVLAISMPFSPDGRYLAVPGRKWVTVIDLTTKKMKVKKFPRWVKSCAFSPDGQTLACAVARGNTFLLDVKTLETIRDFPTDERFADCLAFVPGTKLLAVVGFENRLKLYDAQSGELVRQSDRYASFLATVRVSPDGSRIGVGAMDGKFRIFRTEDCEELISLPVPPSYTFCDFSPTGESVIVAAGSDAFVMHGNTRSELERLTISQLRDMACENTSFYDRQR